MSMLNLSGKGCSAARCCHQVVALQHRRLQQKSRTEVKAGWSDLFAYLQTDNSTELRVVTKSFSKKITGNPLEKYFIVDNKEGLAHLTALTTHHDPHVRSNIRQTLNCVGIVEKPRRGFRILSIDGGGTRGIISISVLKKLEALTNKKAHEMFDLCIGTSTGALLIALLIAQRRPLDEILDIYLDLSKEVFGGRSVLAVGRFVWKQHRYSTHLWEERLREACGGLTMPQISSNACGGISSQDRNPLVAFVSSVVNHEVVHPYVFRSYDLPYATNTREVYRGGYTHEMWEGLRASTAAPSYFKEFDLGSDVHVDGALLYNNPTALGLREAKRMWPGESPSCIVSIGSGKLPWQYRPTDAKPPSLFDTLNHVIAGATETETTHLTLADLLNDKVYFRFNPQIREITPLDEINNSVLDNLILQTDSFIKRSSDKFRACSEALDVNDETKSGATGWDNINKQL